MKTELEKRTGLKIGKVYFSTDNEYLGKMVGFDTIYCPGKTLALLKKAREKNQQYRDRVISPDYIRK